MTDAIFTGRVALDEDVEVGATPAIAIERGTHGHRGFLSRMPRCITLMALRARINRARRYCRGGGLMNDLPHKLRRDGRGRWNRLVGRRCYLHCLFPLTFYPLSGRPMVLLRFFYCVTRPVNKNLRIPCLVLVTQ